MWRIETRKYWYLYLKNNLFLGETVNLFGWLTYKRMNRFLVIKDAYGLIQARIADNDLKKYEDMFNSLTYDTVLRLQGKVLDRNIHVNKKLPTGEVEV